MMSTLLTLTNSTLRCALLYVLVGCGESATTETRHDPSDVDTIDTSVPLTEADQGPPIDIHMLKAEPWLDVTSGVLGTKAKGEICPLDINAFYGEYFLFDRTWHRTAQSKAANGEITQACEGGNVGRLTIRMEEQPKKWSASEPSEELAMLELLSKRVKVWGTVAVGDPKDSLLAFIGKRPYQLDGQVLTTSIGTYHCTFTLVDDVVEHLLIRNACPDRTDTVDVSPAFRSALAACCPGTVIHTEGVIMGSDTISFPKEPAFGPDIVLTGLKDTLAVTVRVKRLTQTSISYHVEMVEVGSRSHKAEGIAELSPHFTLGSETDESSRSGMAYLADEYVDEHANGCHTAIRLGRETESGPYLLGKLIKNCNGKLKDIDLDNYPTLFEK